MLGRAEHVDAVDISGTLHVQPSRPKTWYVRPFADAPAWATSGGGPPCPAAAAVSHARHAPPGAAPPGTPRRALRRQDTFNMAQHAVLPPGGSGGSAGSGGSGRGRVGARRRAACSR